MFLLKNWQMVFICVLSIICMYQNDKINDFKIKLKNKEIYVEKLNDSNEKFKEFIEKQNFEIEKISKESTNFQNKINILRNELETTENSAETINKSSSDDVSSEEAIQWLKTQSQKL